MYRYSHTHTQKLRDGQSGSDRKTDAEIETNRQVDTETEKEIERYICIHSQRERNREADTDRQIYTYTNLRLNVSKSRELIIHGRSGFVPPQPLLDVARVPLCPPLGWFFAVTLTAIYDHVDAALASCSIGLSVESMPRKLCSSAACLFLLYMKLPEPPL